LSWAKTLGEIIFNMSEFEERPTKMRKLDSGADAVCKIADEEAKILDLKTTEQTSTIEPNANNEITSAAHEDAPQDSPAASNVESERQSSVTQDGGGQRLSKNALKKLRKKQEWEAGKEWRREKRKEKAKAKKARHAEERAAQIEAIGTPPPRPKSRTNHSVQVPVSLILDCDFDDLMTDKEILSLGQQITRCYSDNRQANYRTHLVVSSWGGKLKERFETVLANTHLSWKGVKFLDEDFVKAAEEIHDIMVGKDGGIIGGAFGGEPNEPHKNYENIEGETKHDEPKDEPAIEGELVPETGIPEKQASTNPTPENIEAALPALPMPTEPSIVYLSSDSPHTLTSLAPYTSYIIGGIVDKNRHKGLCYRRACERRIPTAKLPIGEFMEMQSRTVLTTNQVIEIMIKWLEKGDWGEAFLEVIPKRKEAKLRGKGDKKKGKSNDQESGGQGHNAAQEEDEDEGDGDAEEQVEDQKNVSIDL
jgi:tRNA (guanine9-N1)-methyltransferase